MNNPDQQVISSTEINSHAPSATTTIQTANPSGGVPVVDPAGCKGFFCIPKFGGTRKNRKNQKKQRKSKKNYRKKRRTPRKSK